MGKSQNNVMKNHVHVAHVTLYIKFKNHKIILYIVYGYTDIVKE